MESTACFFFFAWLIFFWGFQVLFQRWLSISFNGRFNWFAKSLVGNRLFKITKSIHLNKWLVYGVFLVIYTLED